MKQKIMQVMKERDDSKPLSGIIQIDDAYWGVVSTEAAPEVVVQKIKHRSLQPFLLMKMDTRLQ